MKRLILIPIFALGLLTACGPSSSEKKEIEQLNIEAAKEDSIAKTIEQTQQDIDEATKELDKLVNEL